MTRERYAALKDWLIKTALQFYSMNGIFKSVEEKEEWYQMYQKEEILLTVADGIEENKKTKTKKQEKKA